MPMTPCCTTRTVYFMLLGCIFLSVTALAATDMVEVAVEVTEINNTKANQLGIKWFDTVQAGEVGWTAANRTPAMLPEVPSIINVGDWSRYTALSADLKILFDKGAAKILSKPKLVTRSGTGAKFLVGGEFPLVAAGVTSGSIEWKEWGIRTEILPVITGVDTIELSLATEVSRLDWSNSVQGYPAITTRTASSNVKVKSGQTITIAGMLETVKDEQISGVPLLAELPVLGRLFSRRHTVETKTNIVIFVTPKIVE